MLCPGCIYYEMEMQNKAAEMFDQTIEACSKIHQERDIVVKSNFYLWVIYWHQEKYSIAQVHYQKAMTRDSDTAGQVFWTIYPAPNEEKVEKITVAILPFSNQTGDKSLEWISDYIPDELTLKFAAVKYITLVDRIRLEKSLNERGLSLSDIASPSNVLKAGNLKIARKFICGSYQKESDKNISIMWKVIDVETSEVENPSADRENQENLKNLIERVGDNLLLTIDPSTQNTQATKQFMMGNAYSFRFMYKEAVQAFRKSLELMPDWPQVYNNLGNAYVLSSDYETAIMEYTQALKLKPDWPEVCYNLARAYALGYNKAEAINWLKKSLDLNKQFINSALFDPAFKDPEFRKLMGN
jgi:tetratricopeptide (TPR) repeat protein